MIEKEQVDTERAARDALLYPYYPGGCPVWPWSKWQERAEQALADQAAAPPRIRVSRSEVARDSKARALGRMRPAIELVRAEQQPGAKVSKMAAAVRMRSRG